MSEEPEKPPDWRAMLEDDPAWRRYASRFKREPKPAERVPARRCTYPLEPFWHLRARKLAEYHRKVADRAADRAARGLAPREPRRLRRPPKA